MRKRRGRHASQGPISQINHPSAKAPAALGLKAGPAVGRWVWTCRAHFETHLRDELQLSKVAPRVLGPGLVDSSGVPARPPAFARAGFQVTQVLPPGALAVELDRLPPGPLHLQAWAVDTDQGNQL